MGSGVHGAEPTGCELMRTMNDMRGDLRDQFAMMGERLDNNVSKELFTAHKEAVASQFAENGRQLAELKGRQEASRTGSAKRVYWILGILITGIVGPGVVAYITALMTARGK